jgi:hypothetical protein
MWKRIKGLLAKFHLSNKHKVREIARMLGKLNALEPALGKAVFVATRLAAIAVVVATEVSDSVRRKRNPWEQVLPLDAENLQALRETGERLDEWNGHPLWAWHTGIALSSILPMEATASLDRKTPASRVHDRRAVMASNVSDFVVASYSINGIPEFSFCDELVVSETAELSSVRELMAIERTDFRAHGFIWRIGTIDVDDDVGLTDNTNIEKMLAKGSGKLRITRLVLEILSKDRLLRFDIQPVWVSG